MDKEYDGVKFFAFEKNGNLKVIDCFSGLSLDSIIYNIQVERRLENMEENKRKRIDIVDEVSVNLDDAEIPYAILFLSKEGYGNLISNLDEEELIYMLENTAKHLKDEKKKSLSEKIGDLFSWRKDIDDN